MRRRPKRSCVGVCDKCLLPGPRCRWPPSTSFSECKLPSGKPHSALLPLSRSFSSPPPHSPLSYSPTPNSHIHPKPTSQTHIPNPLSAIMIHPSLPIPNPHMLPSVYHHPIRYVYAPPLLFLSSSHFSSSLLFSSSHLLSSHLLSSHLLFSSPLSSSHQSKHLGYIGFSKEVQYCTCTHTGLFQ